MRSATQVPLAILALRQGLGRLIRHRSDRGVLAILDPRLRTPDMGGDSVGAAPRRSPTTSMPSAVSSGKLSQRRP
jgi:ATP-dependent DNA helicase DinG